MCGIAGIWPRHPSAGASDVAMQMIAAVRHRGPNAQSTWSDAALGITLAHARLAILDVSPAGAQPMTSASGRYVIAFNGEIYNHLALRSELLATGSAPAWRGHSDTETLLALIDCHGLDHALRRARGMFALALWDTRTRRLFLARDRFGEKPLYYTTGSTGIAFASELKALLRSTQTRPALSRDAAAALLRYNHVPAPHSVFEGIYKLRPGHILEFADPTTAVRERSFWDIFDVWTNAKQTPFQGTPEEAVDEVERRLTSVVRDQMLSDVPLGAFLSGGIDSSLIVALMQTVSERPARTFSIGFGEERYNEAEAAKRVAHHLGTEHHELYLSPADALAVIPSLPDIYCEPFADSSQIPTYLVSRFAQQHVTVALTGDGGDEVFGGYNRYLFGAQVYPRLQKIPLSSRKLVARVLDSVRPTQWDQIARRVQRAFPVAWRFQDPGDKISKVARALPSKNSAQLYESLLYQWWPDPITAVPGARSSLPSSTWSPPVLAKLCFTEQMMIQDAIAYLPNDILVKVDRATMAVSVEGRIPYLDHELYAFAASLPVEYKVRDGETKWVLKQILHRHVPKALVERAKTGFGIPIDSWLRKELRDWAESLLSPDALSRTGMFDVGQVRSAWSAHLSGARNLQHPLWCVLMYQSWHLRWAL